MSQEQLLYISLSQETDSKEEQGFKTEAANTLGELVRAVEQWETQQMLGGQYDKLGAVLSIQVCKEPLSGWRTKSSFCQQGSLQQAVNQ